MLEKIYTDFTTKLLPLIAEGFTMTKDYFFDLFGRYVKYLIVTDSLWVFLFGVLTFGAFTMVYRGYKRVVKDDWDVGLPLMIVGLLMAAGLLFGFGYNVRNLVKDIFIPEIRIYEQIQYKLHPNGQQK